jgi:hypothetical protein
VPAGEADSIGVAVVAAPGTVSIVHTLEVSGDWAGVHAAPADSILVGERLSEECVWTNGIVPRYWGLVVGVSVPACDAFTMAVVRGRGELVLTIWSLRKSIWEECRSA